MKQALRYLTLLLVALVVCCSATVTAAPASRQAAPLDWRTIASRRPTLKVLALVKNDYPFDFIDLDILAEEGFVPADRRPGQVIGRQQAVFTCRLRDWFRAQPLPEYLSGSLLEHYSITGTYRVGFEVEAKDYTGPLELQITAPRDGFGKKLVSADHEVTPACEQSMTEDAAGNRWLKARLDQVHYGERIMFSFGFRYDVNVREILDHDLWLSGEPRGSEIPPEVQPFLGPGHKIDPLLPAAQDWAYRGGPQPPDARREYKRLSGFIKRNVRYDKCKRSAYFGGRLIYPDIDLMYQDVEETLRRHLGACPDTTVLECTFLRARGIPCLTAGRFGHFFTLLYVPGRGWLSTSVTPTGIPLIRSPGPDHVPYQKWEPKIPLKTTHWEAMISVRSVDMNEVCR